jgi:hypothetical protein
MKYKCHCMLVLFATFLGAEFLAYTIIDQNVRVQTAAIVVMLFVIGQVINMRLP